MLSPGSGSASRSRFSVIRTRYAAPSLPAAQFLFAAPSLPATLSPAAPSLPEPFTVIINAVPFALGSIASIFPHAFAGTSLGSVVPRAIPSRLWHATPATSAPRMHHCTLLGKNLMQIAMGSNSATANAGASRLAYVAIRVSDATSAGFPASGSINSRMFCKRIAFLLCFFLIFL